MASPTEHPLTPSQLNTLARSLLEDSFPSVWVEGEMGNIARPSSGHLYFTLKDAHAQIRCALFKPRGQRLHFQPQEGQKVWARGRLTLYETRGDYQLVLEHLEEAGEGALRQAFEALKAQLGAEGLFSETRKRPLPPWPRRIAVITSPTGAALQDVLSVLSRRFPLIEVDILPSLVQGNAAAPQLIGRLQYAMNCQQYDVILLTRGGGSLEDLWAFNDEHLVRTIAASPVPVVSAVGHETDVTLVDFVADIRAPTPSVAAELIVPHQQDIQRRLQENCRRLTEQFRHRWQQFIQRTDRAVLHLRTQHPLTALAARKQRLSALQYRLQSCWQTKQLQYEVRMQRSHALLRALHFRKTLTQRNSQLAKLPPRLQAAARRILQHGQSQWLATGRALAAVSPLATLSRGYSILKDQKTGALLASTARASIGQKISARLHDGRLQLTIDHIEYFGDP